MRISEFSEKNGVSVRNIRYYISQQLIIPEKRDGFLEFGIQCQKDMEQIRLLKSCGLSIGEIREWMWQERTREPQHRRAFQRALLREKEQHFQEILEEQKKQLEKVSQKKQELGINISQSNTGSSLQLMMLVRCPYCQVPLDYTEVHIVGDQVLYGEGTCSCGYRIMIRNGIFIVQNPIEDASVLAPLDYHRETYNRMQASEITTMQRSFNWIMKRLEEIPLDGKIIFENSINVVSLFSTGMASLKQKPQFIISDSDYYIMLDFKQRIEALNERPNILYIVCNSFEYPLKKGSIDVLIDYYTSEVLQRYPISSLTDKMRPYLHKGSILAGAYAFVERGMGTFSNNRKAYPDSYFGRYRLEAYKQELSRCNIEIMENAKVSLYDISDAITSFKTGDMLGDYCYIGKVRE